MNGILLTEALARLDLRSCLISRRGELVLESYRDPGAETAISNIHSITKSYLSALVCIAMDRGLLPGPETLASVFYPRLAIDEDPRKRGITLEHLLTMSAGFEWTEFGGRNSFPRMTRSPNWIDFVLELPLMDDPGTRMTYNSGLSQMLSALLSRSVGTSTARFAEDNLFGPLGIEAYEWETDPQGVHAGGFGLHLRPADLLKLGQLYLQRGNWGDRQLISRELAERSVRPALRSRDHRQGWYGWHWWSDRYIEKRSDLVGSGGDTSAIVSAATDSASSSAATDSASPSAASGSASPSAASGSASSSAAPGSSSSSAAPGSASSSAAPGSSSSSPASDAAMDYFFARGYGGQFIYVVPSREAVVVLTNDKRKKDQMPIDVFREHIAPWLFLMG